MRSVGSLVPSRTISCCALLPRRAPHAIRPRQTEVLATQARQPTRETVDSAAGSRPAEWRGAEAYSCTPSTPQRAGREDAVLAAVAAAIAALLACAPCRPDPDPAARLVTARAVCVGLRTDS